MDAIENSSQQQAVLRSERIAGGILPKVLNSFDMVAIFVAIVLFISNSGVVAGGAGPASYLYWILGFITFLIPGAIVTGQLGLMFPGEGSIYVWTTKAFGAFMGFFAGFCAWWPGVLVMIATGDAAVALIQQLNPNFLTEPWQQGLVIILIIAFSFVLSILRFRVTQNLVNIIFIAYGCAILLVGVAGITALVSGHIAPVDYSAPNWFPKQANLTIYGTVVLGLLGIEVPLNMGVEVNDSRAITRYLLWGSIVVMLAYLIGTFGIMTAVHSVTDQGNPAASVLAVKAAFGGVGIVLSYIVNIILIGFFLFNTTVYNYSFGRLLFVSGLDRRLPAVMSKVNANKVPWVAVLVQSIISAVFTAIAFILAPFALNAGMKPTDLSTVIYSILQAAVTVIWCVSMVILFIDVIIIRYKYHDEFARKRLAPDWVFYLCSALGMVATAFGVFVTFTNPWVSLVSYSQWILWIGGIGIISLLVGIVLFFIGQATTRGDVSDEDIIAQVTES
ncbi:amino acid permease [Ktedonosporobacter rubrisoli]|uniref:Amino acid permease n=1 Tax=Ktedonosporobacter rubrisoli TaxID=2509675 RepID=A0A4P6K4R0_KTERU|nr:APC family permease [Ktedonosporobacter rubrisoli]QBD83055.1 amino acid permease [Ktedonosporobacter rubrisoli]